MKDILIILKESHWTVPYSNKTYQNLVEAIDLKVDIKTFKYILKIFEAKELEYTVVRTASFYSTILVYII